MGIRIHKALGWGLTAEQMLKFNGWGCCNPDELDDELYDHLTSIKELTFPSKLVQDVFPEWRGFVFQQNLLETEFHLNKENTVNRVADASKLMEPVMTPDEITHYLFWPNAGLAQSLYRYDDTLDYHEAVFDETGKYRSHPCDDLVYPLLENPYPYVELLMDPETGQQHKKEYHHQSSQSHLVPQVLPEIRWWLTEHKIIQPDAWVHIRPYFAKFWS